jgi:hypothetical protein
MKEVVVINNDDLYSIWSIADGKFMVENVNTTSIIEIIGEFNYKRFLKGKKTFEILKKELE